MTIERFRAPRPKQPSASVFPVIESSFAVPRARNDDLTVTWVGHSSVILQAGGRNILTDPVWSDRASPVSFAGPKRWVPPAVPFESLPPVDVVVLSHNHYDHCDLATIRRLVRRNADTTWLAPLGVASLLRRCGAENIIEKDWWQSALVGDLKFTCAPAQHFSARGLLDRDRTLWCSWAIRSATSNIFFGGDTGLHPEFGLIGEQLGPFDVVMLPIGAYEPRWFMRPVHMNPTDAVSAYGQLASGHSQPAFFPIHWGTFKLTDEAMDEPPVKLRTAWNEAGYDSAKLWIVPHGGTRRG